MSTHKRKLFHKNLPKLVRRKLFIKPIEVTESDSDASSDASSDIEEREPRTFIVLHITYLPRHLYTDSFRPILHLSHRLHRPPYSTECPYFEIPIGEKQYKNVIKSTMVREFGITSEFISRIQYKTQVVIDENYYFNIYHVELSTLHSNIPTEYETRPAYTYPPGHKKGAVEPTAAYHRDIWVWKQTIHLRGDAMNHHISIDFFNDATLTTQKTHLCSLTYE